MTSLPTAFEGLSVALGNRYSLERELGRGGMELARIEEARGSPRLSREYYEQFLRRYDHPSASQAHLVEESRAALARLELDR